MCLVKRQDLGLDSGSMQQLDRVDRLPTVRCHHHQFHALVDQKQNEPADLPEWDLRTSHVDHLKHEIEFHNVIRHTSGSAVLFDSIYHLFGRGMAHCDPSRVPILREVNMKTPFVKSQHSIESLQVEEVLDAYFIVFTELDRVL